MKDDNWLAAAFWSHLWRPIGVRMVRELLGSARTAETQGTKRRGFAAAPRVLVGGSMRQPLSFR